MIWHVSHSVQPGRHRTDGVDTCVRCGTTDGSLACPGVQPWKPDYHSIETKLNPDGTESTVVHYDKVSAYPKGTATDPSTVVLSAEELAAAFPPPPPRPHSAASFSAQKRNPGRICFCCGRRKADRTWGRAPVCAECAEGLDPERAENTAPRFTRADAHTKTDPAVHVWPSDDETKGG